MEKESIEWIVCRIFRVCAYEDCKLDIYNAWCEINRRKIKNILTPRCFSSIFISMSFSKGFFVLDFIVNIYSVSCYEVHYFITKLIFVQFLLF